MAKKTNKTSHVLNLLSGSGDAPERKATNNNVTIDDHAKDDPLAENIKNSLLEDMGEGEADGDLSGDIEVKPTEISSDSANLADEKVESDDDLDDILAKSLSEIAELDDEADKEKAETAVEKEVKEAVLPSFGPEKTEEAEVLIEDAFEASIISEPAEVTNISTDDQRGYENGDKAVKRLSDSLGKDDFEFLSVMEYIIEQEIHEYMINFSVCGCSRCTADVMALALTNLPAKFVVAGKDSVSPILNFYSKKYATEVTVALTNACVQVADHPHHVRPR